MEEKNLNSKESLELIAHMIQSTKSKLERGGSVYFLLWGYVSLLTTIAVYIALTLSHNPYYNWIWFAIPVIGLPLMFVIKGKAAKGVTTFIERIIGYVWFVIGVVVMIVPIVSIFLNFRFPVLAVIGILISIGVTLTGLIIKFRTYWICGLICIALSFSTLFFSAMNQIIIYAIIILVSMVIPGHILKSKENKK